MKKSRSLVLAVALVTTLAAIATLWSPTPDGQSTVGFHVQFIEAVLTTGLLLGASCILLLGLRAFTPKFKLAYAAVCAGYSLMGISFLQIPLLTLVTPKIVDLQWVSSGAIILPFLVSSWLLYLGTRGFGRLFGLRGPSTWRWLVLAVSIAGAVIAVILPHAPWHNQTEQGFDGTVGGVIITLTPVLFAGIVAFQAKARASAFYVPFLAGIATVAAFATLSPSLEIFAAFTIRNGIEVITNGVMLIPLVIAGTILFRTAIAFNERMLSEQQAAPRAAAGEAADVSRLAIGAVTCIAQLVSNPQAIDPLLDDLRRITVNLSPQQPLSADEQARLAVIYQKIEQYIETEEPIRRRSRQDIRQIVEHTLPPALGTSQFWQHLA